MARTRRNYRCATAPKPIGVTSITASAPTIEQRAKRANLETQWSHDVKRKAHERKAHGGTYLWAKTGPVSRDGKYRITVKVRGIAKEDYWLEWQHAAALWLDVTGDTLENALREDSGLDPIYR